MRGVNWWLMAIAFVLGLVLTLLLMIGRVKREVPIYEPLGRGPGVGGAAASGKLSGAAAAGAALAGGAALAAGAAGKDKEPYGDGSIRVAATADAPEGYTIKGNEDSMLYHTTDSPSYTQTIAEVWFRDVETAEKAGFARWDSGKSQRGQE